MWAHAPGILCTQLTNVDGLHCLAGLGALQTLTLDLQQCTQLAKDLQKEFSKPFDFLAALKS